MTFEDRFWCQECGRMIPKGRYSCSNCGSEDIDCMPPDKED